MKKFVFMGGSSFDIDLYGGPVDSENRIFMAMVPVSNQPSIQEIEINQFSICRYNGLESNNPVKIVRVE